MTSTSMEYTRTGIYGKCVFIIAKPNCLQWVKSKDYIVTEFLSFHPLVKSKYQYML